jgi:hypothetical protein
MSIILATQEAEIKRIAVQSHPGQIVHETISRKTHHTKKGWWSGSRCRLLVQTPVPKKKKRNQTNKKHKKAALDFFYLIKPLETHQRFYNISHILRK